MFRLGLFLFTCVCSGKRGSPGTLHQKSRLRSHDVHQSGPEALRDSGNARGHRSQRTHGICQSAQQVRVVVLCLCYCDFYRECLTGGAKKHAIAKTPRIAN